MSVFTLHVTHIVLEVTARQEKELKLRLERKCKKYLFADNLVLHVQNPN
jgi:hypothetical protein